MASTRAQRRRRYALWSLALAVVFLGSLFARDVSRSAHGAVSPRRSENRDFAALANALISQENSFDQRFSYLVTHGENLSRPIFYSRLTQLEAQLPTLSTESELASSPSLAHHVNNSLDTLTGVRVEDYATLLSSVASSLSLPWTSSTGSGAPSTVANAQASLVSTTGAWDVDRFALVREPGRVSLPATTDLMGTLDVSGALSTLANSPSLAVTRGIGITAILINPAPLPAPSGELLLPPSSSMRLGVTVTNASFVLQRVAFSYTFVQTNGARTSQSQTMTVTLGPLGSYAFVPKLVTVTSGERAALTLDVSGAPAGPSMTTSRHYLVIVSPSGN